ncbi:MAG: YggS family pyridoxal phosphate-dependent enzyme [Bacteroidales bacterium]
MINKKEIDTILENLPSETKLVAVSKFKSNESILAAYNYGLRDFGENRPQELSLKMEEIPNEDIKWHFIGHLQRNKIKMIIDKVYLIHSIDSEKLLAAVNKEAAKRDIIVNCLLQLYIAKEDSKQGFSQEELEQVVENLSKYPNVRVCGLMGMASFTQDKNVVAAEFVKLKETFCSLKQSVFVNDVNFKELSMGMSSDYLIAIEHGSTLVRIGSLVFGSR